MQRNGSPQIPGAQQNGFPPLVKPQDLPDLLIQILHVVAIPLLPKAAEAV